MTLERAIVELHDAGRFGVPPGPGSTAWAHFDGERLSTGDVDLTDPADVGCLLAIAREVSGAPYLRIRYSRSLRLWQMVSDSLRLNQAAAEGDAVAAFLIDWAERL